MQIPQDRQAAIWQQSRSFPTNWGRWNAYLNHLCLETCLDWLKAERLPSAKAETEPSLWEMVNGAIVTVDKIRIALIPTEAVDRSQIEVAQEWVDVPSWAADYYLAVQIAPNSQELAIYGYTTHQQLKTQGTYDPQDRTYCLDVEDLIPDLNALWLSYPRYTTSQTRAPLDSLTRFRSRPSRAINRPPRKSRHDRASVSSSLSHLGSITRKSPMATKTVPATANGRYDPSSYQLGQWFQGEIDRGLAIARSGDLTPTNCHRIRSGNTPTPAPTSPEEIYRAKIYHLDARTDRPSHRHVADLTIPKAELVCKSIHQSGTYSYQAKPNSDSSMMATKSDKLVRR